MHSPFRRASRALALPMLALPALAQGVTTPGMPQSGRGLTSSSGNEQATGTTNEFNPTIGAVLDALGSWRDAPEDDGLDLEVRSFELSVGAWVDPVAWAYAVIVAEELEEVAVEEAAVHYRGLGGNTTLRVGRFFVDFGKQMQAHVHDLRTIDRPGPLREYLGAELAGTGVQYEDWRPLGDATLVRWSFGAFQSLLGEEHGHGEEEEEGGPELVESELKDLDELALTARLTGFSDVSESQTVQLGASARYIPEFGVEAEMDEVDGLSNLVWGLDATWGWRDETATKRIAAGFEWLFVDGDLEAEVDGATMLIDVADGRVSGGYAWAEGWWNRSNAVGVQAALWEEPDASEADVSEYDLYYTHLFSEFHRLRAGVTYTDPDGESSSTRVGFQYTVFLGPHSHGVNW